MILQITNENATNQAFFYNVAITSSIASTIANQNEEFFSFTYDL